MNLFETHSEIIAHISALKSIADADSIITDRSKEQSYISNLIAVYEKQYPEFAPIQESSKELTKQDIAKSLTSRKSKMLLMQDLFSLAWLDGKFSTDEEGKIRKIARDLNISEDDVVTLEKLNIDFINANSRIAQFIMTEA